MTSPMKDFKIQFVGLKVGSHYYSFKLDKEFFEHFEYTEIEECDIQVDVHLIRQNHMLEFELSLSGDVSLECDRCQGEIMIDLAGQNQLIVKFGEETGLIEDEILILGPSEFEVDLTQYIYEYTHLALPQRNVHLDEGECDQDMINKLNEISSRGDDNIDPRWEALKKL